MDPLASWMLVQWQAATTWDQRGLYEEGMRELGYWLMERPIEMDEAEWRVACNLTLYNDCDWVQEFEWDDPDIEGCQVVMSVYKERE